MCKLLPILEGLLLCLLVYIILLVNTLPERALLTLIKQLLSLVDKSQLFLHSSHIEYVLKALLACAVPVINMFSLGRDYVCKVDFRPLC